MYNKFILCTPIADILFPDAEFLSRGLSDEKGSVSSKTGSPCSGNDRLTAPHRFSYLPKRSICVCDARTAGQEGAVLV